MNLNKSDIHKIRGLIVFFIILLFALYRFDSILSVLGFILSTLFPFAVGGAIAFILSIPMGFFERKLFADIDKEIPKGKKGYLKAQLARPLSLVLAIIAVLGVLFIVIVVVVPELAHTVATLTQVIPQKFPQWMANIQGYLNDYPEIVEQLQAVEVNWDEIFSTLTSFFQTAGNTILDSTWNVAKNIVGAFANFFIGFSFACYVLLQKETLARQTKKLLFAYLPKDLVDNILRICKLTHDTFASFLSGQCLEACILGLMFYVAMLVLRFPYALLVGVLVAFTALIPIFGAFIGCFVGAFLILTVDPIQSLMFILLFLILQQIEGNLIYPHVVGNSVGLPSIWVLAAVSIGASLMGIAGMLLFIPIVSVVYTLLRESVNRRLEKRKLKVE